MNHAHDKDSRVVNAVEDAVIPHSNSIGVRFTFQLLGTWRMWFIRQGIDPVGDPLPSVLRDLGQFRRGG